MAKLIFDIEKIDDSEAFMALCPFGAIERENGGLHVNAACKMCGVCAKIGPLGAAIVVEDTLAPQVDKSQWRGVAVYADHLDGRLHPVTFELIGKARELAGIIAHPVCALLVGSDLSAAAEELLHYGVDTVCLYDHPALERFRIEAYTDALEDFALKQRPSSILVGATPVGRQLAPRVAARLRTGLTADCTALEMEKNTDLVQIRPAFGGNIMAQIVTPAHRPQMATVRYKVMDAPARRDTPSGAVVVCAFPWEKSRFHVQVLGVHPKPQVASIENADVLVVAGRGVKKQEELAILQELAALLGGQLACTRPVAESGWMEANRQIGLSGRTVRPKLIITCGVSGAIQFLAGMEGAGHIIAINQDEKAPIFKLAHCGLVGDLYAVLPLLVEHIKMGREVPA